MADRAGRREEARPALQPEAELRAAGFTAAVCSAVGPGLSRNRVTRLAPAEGTAWRQRCMARRLLQGARLTPANSGQPWFLPEAHLLGALPRGTFAVRQCPQRGLQPSLVLLPGGRRRSHIIPRDTKLGTALLGHGITRFWVRSLAVPPSGIGSRVGFRENSLGSHTMRDWVNALLEWYRGHRRSLPWRAQPTPYRVWISEIMLQQTQVATVQPYFERFTDRFPTLGDLAAADLQDVLKLWEGLGYYSRARNLHRAAGIVVSEHGGRVPADPARLRSLPGIGRYTAAAIASIAYGRPHPVVDGNVARVCARLWCIETDMRSSRAQRDLEQRLCDGLDCSGDPAAFNQALMELGALVCRPRAPVCAACPLRAMCGALAAGRTADLPVRRPAPRLPHYRIAVGLIEHEGRVLIARRGDNQMLGGLWEFPGGKQEETETAAETVVREVREEVSLAVRVGLPACTIRHAYSHFRITLTAFHCLPVGDPASAHCDRPLEWVPWDRLAEYPLPKANHKILAALGRTAKAVPADEANGAEEPR